MFQIHDDFLRVRSQIRIRGSVDLITDPDPCTGLRIRIRIRIRILLCSSVALKILSDKLLRRDNTIKLSFFLVRRIRIRANDYESGSGIPKKVRSGSGTLLLSARIIQYGSCCTLYYTLADSCLLSLGSGLHLINVSNKSVSPPPPHCR